ncbi:MAG: orotidine-5'-phosphate decarboxylase [Flavobacteriales bacterium CG18_big_fil_WC_8_21_14_2_50_32_9]|nr:MAG: orotidine-5'-phosphate decarboxylase [Flavobacteriales bacterium CG18_big_fil_WC_8_21_14_2_50_32_9]PJC63210.1 MAG: orotidine-5'-phosphate decarboxylase [Flavobacteriales bacterium CG_4_9_14_0_2_um_filter_32_27]
MTKQELIKQIRKKASFLCVGLDTDLTKIPSHLLKEKDPIFEFNKQIIDATYDLCVAYKPNTAFYEVYGSKGWEALQKTLEYIPNEHFTIADAKRGDIGNTSTMYAKAFFETLNFDAITVAPYMGEDSVTPFLKFKDKWVILLALTSNKGANDFQFFEGDKEKLFEKVLQQSKKWGDNENLMYVVGATRPEILQEIRKIVPDNFLLVPGVGAQGGSLAEVCKFGMNKNVGLLINSSRGIIYAGNDKNFAKKSRIETQKIQEEMHILLNNYLY